MKKITILFPILCILITIFNSADSKESTEANKVIEYYKCDIYKAFISNINASPTQHLYDDKGNPQRFIKRGSAELYVGHDKIDAAAIDSKKYIELIKNHSKWIIADKKRIEGGIVGLAQESINILIFADNKWWLVLIYPESIGIAEAEIILEKNGVKVATLKMGVQPNVSDDPDIIDAFTAVVEIKNK